MKITQNPKPKIPYLFQIKELTGTEKEYAPNGSCKNYDSGFMLRYFRFPDVAEAFNDPILRRAHVHREYGCEPQLSDLEMFKQLPRFDQDRVIETHNAFFSYGITPATWTYDNDISTEIKGTFQGKQGKLLFDPRINDKDAKVICFRLALDELVLRSMERNVIDVPETYAKRGLQVLLNNPKETYPYGEFLTPVWKYKIGSLTYYGVDS